VKPIRTDVQMHRSSTWSRQPLPLTERDRDIERLARQNIPETDRKRILRAQFDTDNDFRKWNRRQVFEETGLEVENQDARRARRRKNGVSRTRL